METNQFIPAAKVAVSSGSSDAQRAAMMILRSGNALTQAKLTSVFETAQHDLIRELARLKNKDLVTFHIDKAMMRVHRILEKMRADSEGYSKDLVDIQMTGGKLSSRIKGRSGKFESAFVFTQAEERRVERFLSQMLGQIGHAAGSAEQNIRNQVMNACVTSTIPKDSGIEEPEAAITSIESGTEVQPIDPKKIRVKKLTHEEMEALKNDPMKAAKKTVWDSKRQISFMRTQYVMGRREADKIRQETLKAMAVNEARGSGLTNATSQLTANLMRDGITAFRDRGGKRWTLPNYCNMTVRTTSRQCSNMGELFEDEEHDLYRIVPHGSTCPICSKLEGRVYSRSGTNPKYPPLASAFGRIDKTGPATLENSYLNIHPNCRHVLARFVERGRSPEELKRIQEQSSFETNPANKDPRTEREVAEYQERERLMGIHNQAVRKYREFLQFIPASRLGNALTFKRHYLAKDDKYREWEREVKGEQSKIER